MVLFIFYSFSKQFFPCSIGYHSSKEGFGRGRKQRHRNARTGMCVVFFLHHHCFVSANSCSVSFCILQMMNARPLLMGQVAALVKDVKPAAEIMNEMINDAIAIIRRLNGTIAKL
jgi:hypothetical protein